MKKLILIISGAVTLALGPTLTHGDIILPNDDVFVETSTDALTTTTFDRHIASSQVAFGLGAVNGVATGRRRSYIEFTLGTDPVGTATLNLYNYWGANMGGGGNPAASATIRLRGAAGSTPVEFTEPAFSSVTDFVPPGETNFVTILSTATGAVGAVGSYQFDITSWYNARLGQTTTLLLRGAAVSGFDFPLFEDREGTAFLNGSENTMPNMGPRIETTPVPDPTSLLLLPLGGGLLLLVCRRQR